MQLSLIKPLKQSHHTHSVVIKVSKTQQLILLYVQIKTSASQTMGSEKILQNLVMQCFLLSIMDLHDRDVMMAWPFSSASLEKSSIQGQ